MAHRIEIALGEGVRDARGERVKREIAHFLHLPVAEVRSLDVYTVDAELTPAELAEAAAGPFSDPIIQTYTIDLSADREFDFLVEVGFRPGVTDNVGRTAREAIEYITGRPFQQGEGVYTSVQYLFTGRLSRSDVERIATPLSSASSYLIGRSSGPRAESRSTCRKSRGRRGRRSGKST
jgi:phosphoribosylformylglycinamidine (FGAM) synthase PurS component